MTAVEEAAGVANDEAATTMDAAGTLADVASVEPSLKQSSDPLQAPDPLQALVQVGAQFVAALATANDPKAPAPPWIERDPVTGARNLKMQLPPPETMRLLAGALVQPRALALHLQDPACLAQEPLAQRLALAAYCGEIIIGRAHQRGHQQGAHAGTEFLALDALLLSAEAALVAIAVRFRHRPSKGVMVII